MRTKTYSEQDEKETYNWYRFGGSKVGIDWDKDRQDKNDEDISDTVHEIGIDYEF